MAGFIKEQGTATIPAGTPGVAGSIAVALTSLLATDRVFVCASNTTIQDVSNKKWQDVTFQVTKTAGTGFTVGANQAQNPQILVDYIVVTPGVQTTKVADEDIDGDYITQVALDSTGASVALTNLVVKEVGQRVSFYCEAYTNAMTVTCKAGTTLNGTNTIATFNAAEDYIELVAVNATTFAVVSNTSVVLS